MEILEKLLTPCEAAKMLGYHEEYIRAMFRDGTRLKGYKKGHAVFTTPEDINIFKKARKEVYKRRGEMMDTSEYKDGNIKTRTALIGGLWKKVIDEIRQAEAEALL